MTTDTTIQTGLTKIGQSILTQAQLGANLAFTKVKIGDGELGDIDPSDLTDLINPLQELGIYDKDKIDEQTMSITALITQSETGYTFREIGLFAIDPETGLEVLYAYGNKGDVATYIPSNISSISIEEEATIIVEVANASSVIINLTKEYGANCSLSNLSLLGEKRFQDLWEEIAQKSSIDLDNLSSIGQAILDRKVEVEALLQQNGYAKFTWKENNQISNLIINWGITNAKGSRSFVFPLTFNDYFTFCSTVATASGNVVSTINAMNENGGNLYPSDTSRELSIFWFAIGA